MDSLVFHVRSTCRFSVLRASESRCDTDLSIETVSSVCEARPGWTRNEESCELLAEVGICYCNAHVQEILQRLLGQVAE